MSEPWGLLGLLRATSEHEDVLRGAASACGLELALAPSLLEAEPILKLKTTRAVVVEASAQGAETLCQMARHLRFPGDIAVLVGAHMLTDAAFARAYDWGADDVVSLDSERALLARLSGLPRKVVLRRGERRSALIGHPDRTLGTRIARMLGDAGYDVERTDSVAATLERVERDSLDLLVLSFELGQTERLVRQLLAGAHTPAVVIWARPQDVAALQRALEGYDRVEVLSQQTPLDSILFASNGLVYDSNSLSARADRRCLYGTTVLFRESGTDEPDYGFTYNIGPRGMYVRTLALPRKDRVSVEIRPPNGRRRLRLVGDVAWRRSFGLADRPTAPPGFGLSIRAEPDTDHALWLRHFDAGLAASSGPAAPGVEAPAQRFPGAPVALGVEQGNDGPTVATGSALADSKVADPPANREAAGSKPSAKPSAAFPEAPSAQREVPILNPSSDPSSSEAAPAAPREASVLDTNSAEPSRPTPDSWFSSYAASAWSGAPRPARTPGRVRSSALTGLPLATVLVLLLSALTVYLYVRSHPGVLSGF
jgi:hypothetical protein